MFSLLALPVMSSGEKAHFAMCLTGILAVSSVMVIHQWHWKWWTRVELSCLEKSQEILVMWVFLLAFWLT